MSVRNSPQSFENPRIPEAIIKKVAAERGVNGQDLITALSGSYGSHESPESPSNVRHADEVYTWRHVRR